MDDLNKKALEAVEKDLEYARKQMEKWINEEQRLKNIREEILFNINKSK